MTGGDLVVGREEHPPLQAVLLGEPEKEFGLLGVGTGRPTQPSTRVARDTGQTVRAFDDPHLDAAPAEAAHDPETLVIAAGHERADIALYRASCHRASARAIVRPAKPLPATNRINGPNVGAAGAPVI